MLFVEFFGFLQDGAMIYVDKLHLEHRDFWLIAQLDGFFPHLEVQTVTLLPSLTQLTAI